MKINISSIWHKFSENGIDIKLDDPEKKRIRILNRIIFINAVLALIFIIVDLSNFSYEGSLISTVTFLISILLFFIIKNKLYKVAKWIILLFIILYISAICLLTGKDSGMIVYFIPGILFPTLIFENKKAILALSILIGVVLISVFCVNQFNNPQIIISEDEVTFYNISSLLGCTVLTLLILWYFRKTNKEYEEIIINKNKSLVLYNDEIKNQKLKLEEKNKGITDSINYASKIQQAILPTDLKLSYLLKDYFLFFLPKDIVSGDFYWIEKVNNKTYIAIADCTGHGVPGAMVSVVCINALNRSIQEFNLIQPKDVLNKTRELVIEAFNEKNKMIKDGMDIAICCIDSESNKLLFSGANNPLTIIRNNEATTLLADRQPIGKFSFGKPFTQQEKILKKGDLIYMYSDGFADQFGGEKGKKYKSSSLINFLSNHSNKTLNEQKKILQDEFMSWKSNFEQIDDVCILGFKI